MFAPEAHVPRLNIWVRGQGRIEWTTEGKENMAGCSIAVFHTPRQVSHVARAMHFL